MKSCVILSLVLTLLASSGASLAASTEHSHASPAAVQSSSTYDSFFVNTYATCLFARLGIAALAKYGIDAKGYNILKGKHPIPETKVQKFLELMVIGGIATHLNTQVDLDSFKAIYTRVPLMPITTVYELLKYLGKIKEIADPSIVTNLGYALLFYDTLYLLGYSYGQIMCLFRTLLGYEGPCSRYTKTLTWLNPVYWPGKLIFG